MVELHLGSRHGWTPAPRGYGSATVSWRSQASAASRSSLKILTSSVPLPLVGDLLRVLGDGAGGDDGDDPAQLHDVADGGLEGGGDGVSVGAGAQLDPQREGVVVALAADDDLGPAHALHRRDDLVGLAGL